MRAVPVSAASHSSFSVREIARAAGVAYERAAALVAECQPSRPNSVPREDAVRIVRVLTGRLNPRALRPALSVVSTRRRRRVLPLAVALALHVLVLIALIGISSLGWLDGHPAAEPIASPAPLHLVYLIQDGPGGGGGGGGLRMQTPPPRAKRAASAKHRLSSPVPPPRRTPPTPTPVVVPPPRPTPPPPVPRPVEHPAPAIVVPPAPPAPTVPVAAAPADPIDKPGVLADSGALAPSNGTGTGGGIGSGAGDGIGEGRGSGIGPGSGGGTGGGPYGPGSGIAPPSLVREVRADYTDAARRQGIEGSVHLQVVVRRDGSVTDVRIVNGLGGGLDRQAVDAVKQWRFSPATRFGQPVDVTVDVSVDFRLR